MKEKRKNIKSDLKKSDRHRIQAKEYNELPELTDDMFERAVYKVKNVKKTPPKLKTKKLGKSEKSQTTIPVSLSLPIEVIHYFKSEGSNWQTKIRRALKDWIKHHPHSH